MSPFVSRSQRGYLYTHHPKLAKEFERATPKKPLPYRVKKVDMAKMAMHKEM